MFAWLRAKFCSSEGINFEASHTVNTRQSGSQWSKRAKIVMLVEYPKNLTKVMSY